MGRKQNYLLGNVLEESGKVFLYAFLLPAGWNAEVMAEAQAAILDRGEKATY